MSGWVPIPHVAIAAAGREGRAAVLELYERAHRTGYAPRPWTERELAEEWGLDRRTVVRLLCSLAGVGAIVIERSASGSRAPSTLVVVPTLSRDADQQQKVPTPNVHQNWHQNGNQAGNQMRHQNDEPTAEALADTAPDTAPDAAPDGHQYRHQRARRSSRAPRSDQIRSEKEQDTRPPVADGSLPLPEEPNDGVPKWARLKGHRRHDVLGGVVAAIEAITQRRVSPDRCATDAKHVIALQRITGTPWAELAGQIAAVAEWARDSGDPLAENDIRGLRADGTLWGTDRSRSVATLTVQAKWADRLRAAEEWARPAEPEPVWHNDLRGPPRMRRASGPA